MIFEDRVADALRGLVNDGQLAPEQAAQVAERLRAATAAPQDPSLGRPTAGRSGRGVVAEVLSYLGGALVLAAVCTIGGSTREHLSVAAGIAITGAASLALIGAAVAVWLERGTPGGGRRPARTGSTVRRRLARVLAGLGALGVGATTGLIAEDRWDWQAAAVGGALLAAAVPLYVVLRGPVLAVAVWLGGLLVLIDTLTRVDDQATGWRDTLAVWALGVTGYATAWMVAAATPLIAETGVSAELGGLTGLVGALFAAVTDRWAGLGLALAGLLTLVAWGGFALTRSAGFAVSGALVALVVPATALGVLLDSVLATGVLLLVVGAPLVTVGVLLAMRRGRQSASVA